ncbi:uncharacterized protein LOC134263532 [Saccostrea cucullata]|uniref:uncharacterized protein LOC134263532 n=1 Tax=Saccostrea cuccullata TaxID=36930 RepID=UPI002ED04490
MTQNFTCSCIAGYTGGICQTDIDECEIDPCTFLFDCIDGLNDWVCKLNEFKLTAIVTTLALIAGITIFIIYKNKKKYKEVDHSWLSNYLDVRKPDSQLKLVYQPKSVQNLKQPSSVCKLFSLRFKNFLK